MASGGLSLDKVPLKMASGRLSLAQIARQGSLRMASGGRSFEKCRSKWHWEGCRSARVAQNGLGRAFALQESLKMTSGGHSLDKRSQTRTLGPEPLRSGIGWPSRDRLDSYLG